MLTRPIPAKLPELYRTLGTNYDERVLPSIIQVSPFLPALRSAHFDDSTRISSSSCLALENDRAKLLDAESQANEFGK